MVYSHTISLAKSATVGGAPYSWEEVTPGSAKDKLPWEVFLTACKEIGYDGYLSHEQCSPIIVKGHKLGGLDTVDQRYIEARNTSAACSTSWAAIRETSRAETPVNVDRGIALTMRSRTPHVDLPVAADFPLFVIARMISERVRRDRFR